MKRLILGLLAFVLVLGIAAFVVAPAVGNQYRLWRDARSIREYRREVGALDTLACGTRLAQARQYNEGLSEIALQDAFDAAYPWGEDAGAEALDVTGSGVIAVLELPKLGVILPVYRGFSQMALARGVVHLEGTSLPVGGEGTQSVLAGQGGGRFAGLFDGLDRLIPGDCFYIQTLQDTMIYEVAQVDMVEPAALSTQPVDPKGDRCILMTAAREGDAERRLLVQARRIRRLEAPLEDDTQLLPGWQARMVFAVPVALAGLVLLALVEGLRRALRRRRLKRMKL